MLRSEVPPSAPVAWSNEWACELAAQALAYLAENFPECGGSEILDSYQDVVHAAAIREDRDAYANALRDFIRAAEGA
jgi:hypothetical protein